MPDKIDVTKYIYKKPHDGNFSIFNMMLFSEPGEGKTPLLGSIEEVPEMLPALLIDADGGTLSIRNRQIDTIHLVEMSKKENKSEWDCLGEIKAFLSLTKHSYKTDILDGGSDLEKFCEKSCLDFGKDKNRDKAHDPEILELSDWNRVSDRMSRMYTGFRDIVTVDGRKLNFIATAHESRKNWSDGSLVIQPLFFGQLSPKLASRFDIFARLSHMEDPKTKKLVTVLIPSLDGRVRGRDRSFTLGKQMLEPTMKKIYDKIQSGIIDKYE